MVSRLRLRGTHDRGWSKGFTPTEKVYKDTAIVIHRLSGGKIVEEWSEGSGLAELRKEHPGQERIEHERVDQELQVARDIQLGSLPEGVPTLEDWQIDPYCQPAREVGGEIPRALALPTPTPATTYPTYTVTVRPRSSGPGGCR